MKSSNHELIPRPVHELGTSATIVGTRQKGVGYYGGQGNSQQIRFQCNDFPGQVIVQASLDTDPKTADPTGEIPYAQATDWFDAYTFPNDSADGSSLITTDQSITLYGKFTWVRAVVTDFTDGEIGPITMSY